MSPSHQREQTLYATDAKSGNVEVFHLPDGRKITTIPVRLFPQRMAFSKDRARLYVVNSASNNVSVIDTGTHTLFTNIAVNERPYDIVMAPENSTWPTSQVLKHIRSLSLIPTIRESS